MQERVYELGLDSQDSSFVITAVYNGTDPVDIINNTGGNSQC